MSKEKLSEMLTCNDCIHACVCPYADGAEYRNIDMIREDCEYFARSDNDGEWEKRDFIIFDFVKTGYRCTSCGTTWDAPTKFCPNCGAKMKGGAE